MPQTDDSQEAVEKLRQSVASDLLDGIDTKVRCVSLAGTLTPNVFPDVVIASGMPSVGDAPIATVRPLKATSTVHNPIPDSVTQATIYRCA